MKKLSTYHSILATALLIGVIAFTTIGCAGTSRSNSSGFSAGFIDPDTGTPVWVQQFEDWDREAHSNLSKTKVNEIAANETRNADGSMSYGLTAQGVATSPELNNLERLMGMLDRYSQGGTRRFGVNVPPQTNSLADQIILSTEQFDELLRRGVNGGIGGSVASEEYAFLQPQAGATQATQNPNRDLTVYTNRVAAGTSSEDPGQPAVPDPAEEFTPSQLEQLDQLFERRVRNLIDGEKDTPPEVGPEPPAESPGQ